MIYLNGKKYEMLRLDVGLQGGDPVLQEKTASPTEQTQQITADSGYDGLSKVTLNPISSSYVGSGITRRSSSDMSASGATVTAPAGYYASPASKAVASGSVTVNAPTVSATGLITASARVTGGYVSTNPSNATLQMTTKGAATITPGTTDQTIASGQYLTGVQTIAGDADLVAGNIKKGVNIFGVTGTYEGGGGGGINVATSENTLSSAAASIQFTGLLGDPTSFAVVSASNLTTGASPYKTADVVFDGTNIFGQYITNTNNAQMTYSASAFTKSYSGGSLTITGSGTNFQPNTYKLVYTYGGSTSDILTKTATVGSGATSISFTGLDAEPVAFSCILKGGNIGTASGYSRAQIVVGDGENVFGLHMGSSSQASTSSWTTSYNNGTFTITSVSASNGGYFHQGTGFSYQLTYVTDTAPIEITTEPLTVTDNGTYTAPRGKAYTPVVVSVPKSGGGNIDASKSVTPSSNATTVTISGLLGQPQWFMFFPIANVPAASGSRRVTAHTYAGNDQHDYGWALISSGSSWSVTYSVAVDSTNFSHTYSNGTLTLNSGSASTGGVYYNVQYALVYGY